MDSTTQRRARHSPSFARVHRLVVVSSPDAAAVGRVLEAARGPLVVGREAEGLGRIADPSLSRRHLRIMPVGAGEWVVEDLDTANGTYAHGVRVRGASSVAPHTVLRVGDTLLVHDVAPPPSGLPSSAGASGEAVSEVVGTSLASAALRRSIATVAATDGAVLLLGPTGSGKEVAARAIHRLSGRAGPWVAVNCAALPAELADAELFGARRGAYTGATEDRAGLFVQASGGSLFLDELGDLPPPVQAKLLRVLEDGRVQPLGGGAPTQVDVRVMGATSQDLETRGFRQDLVARLGDWTLHVPPLAERRPDVLALWSHFAPPGLRLPADVAELLAIHDWPMNVRELAKLVRRLATLAGPHGEVEVEMLPEAMVERLVEEDGEHAGAPETKPGTPPPDRAALARALEEVGGNLQRLSVERGWHRTQIYRWARRHGLDLAQYR